MQTTDIGGDTVLATPSGRSLECHLVIDSRQTPPVRNESHEASIAGADQKPVDGLVAAQRQCVAQLVVVVCRRHLVPLHLVPRARGTASEQFERNGG